MTAILRAPELSATSRIDRIWIMACLLDLHRFSHDLFQRPTLAAAERTRLDDLDHVADLRRVLLVVDHELRRAPLGLAVHPVAHLPFDGDDATLLHPIADDDADFLCFRGHVDVSQSQLVTGYLGELVTRFQMNSPAHQFTNSPTILVS